MALSEDDLIEGLLTRQAAATLLGCHVNTLDKMIANGEIEAFRLHRGVRLTRAACIEALNRTSSLTRARAGRPRKGAA